MRTRLALALAAALLGGEARADVTVTGDAADLKVEASGEATAEVVAAMGAALGIELAVPAEVEAGTVSGVYQGSLAVVLRALMPQASFVVTRRTGDDRGLSVRFLGPPSAEPTVSARAADGEPSDADPQARASRRQPPPDRRRPPSSGDAEEPQGAGRSAPPVRQVY